MTKADKRENIIMIASEPLTFERSDWMEVKTNTMIVITPKVSDAFWCMVGELDRGCTLSVEQRRD
jgi:hypothetical protein